MAPYLLSIKAERISRLPPSRACSKMIQPHPALVALDKAKGWWHIHPIGWSQPSLSDTQTPLPVIMATNSPHALSVETTWRDLTINGSKEVSFLCCLGWYQRRPGGPLGFWPPLSSMCYSSTSLWWGVVNMGLYSSQSGCYQQNPRGDSELSSFSAAKKETLFLQVLVEAKWGMCTYTYNQ